MKKKNNPKNKGSVIPILVILGVILLRSAADEPEVLYAALPIIIVLIAVAAVVSAAKKQLNKDGEQPVKNRPAPAAAAKRPAAAAKTAKAASAADEIEAEEAIHCAHCRGKEKYIEQLGYYLKAGLIDREEYRVMKARYEKLDLPEDYH